MRSFIPWVGGKSQLSGAIRSCFPSAPPGRYIEVFGGAGWILFSRERHAPLEVFNDLDGNLINLYRCIKYHCAELQRELRGEDYQWLPNSRELFLDYLAQLDLRGLTDIQRAARYFYIIRISFGADRRSYICKDTARAMLNAIDRLPDIQTRLREVVIENRDFEALLKTYDRKDALIYLDPPYFDAEDHYDGFNKDDHQRLYEATHRLKGGFLLSYNDHPEIRKMYHSYNIREINRANPLTSKRGAGLARYQELIITNY